jgi:hypothetical protein
VTEKEIIVDELAQSEDIAAEKSLRERYDGQVLQLQLQNGWSPRKARRALDAMARKNVKRFMNRAQTTNKIDVSDITPETVGTEEE